MRLKKFKIDDAFYFIRKTKSSFFNYGWLNGSLTKMYSIQSNNGNSRVSYFVDGNFKRFYI